MCWLLCNSYGNVIVMVLENSLVDVCGFMFGIF